MRIFLYQDRTLNLNLEALSKGLKNITKGELDIDVGRAEFKLKKGPMKYPLTHQSLSASLLNEVQDADYALLLTKVPYENNYFYETEDKVTILSFYAWEHLTDLPRENGVVFFLASLLRYSLPLPEAHQLTTGCINDFLWDKSSVDSMMRSTSLCKSCQAHLARRKLRWRPAYLK
jgi:hypothetical protein